MPSRCPISAGGRVVEGHALLQPRVTPTLPEMGWGTLFQLVFSGPRGIDLYAFAVSDLGRGTGRGRSRPSSTPCDAHVARDGLGHALPARLLGSPRHRPLCLRGVRSRPGDGSWKVTPFFNPV